MASQTEPSPLSNEGTPLMAENVLLLQLVGFKWLMAGLGWWIDMSRFLSDPSYASYFLKLADTSDSAELRKSATVLKSRSGIHGE